ncbi:MAG: aryl-sulfate sulfotransferase [Pseudomonadota bacterium]
MIKGLPSARLLLLVAAGLAVACPKEDDPPPDTGPDTDTAFFGAFTLTQSEAMPTVVTAVWTTAEPVSCTLTYGAEGEQPLTTVEGGAPSTTHEVALVGLPPMVEASLVVSAEASGGLQQSDEQPFQTGALPAGMPALTFEVDDPEQIFHGFTLVPIISESDYTAWVCVFDDAGRAVWAYPARRGCTRARLAPDGGGILFHDEDMDPEIMEPLGAVTSVAWDGTVRWQFEQGNRHHDFAILGEDRFVTLGTTTTTLDPGGPDEMILRGDTLVEFDSAGNTREIWSVFDAIDPEGIPTTDCVLDPETGTWDWSHGNYLTWVPETGEVLATLRNIDAIVAVDVEVGQMTWSLSNTWGTYQPAGDQPLLAWPHSVEPVEGGLLVFNQTTTWTEERCSQGAILALDPKAGVATTTWEYETPECTQVLFLGSAQQLPDGNVLVVFSQGGLMDEVTPDGARVARIRATFGNMLGYAHRIAELRPVAY